MKDIRLEKLAKSLINYSVKLKKGERVLIKSVFDAKPLVLEIVKEVLAVGGIPIVRYTDSEVSSLIMKKLTDEIVEDSKNRAMKELGDYEASIRIYYNENDYEGSEIPSGNYKKMSLAFKDYQELAEKKKWVLLNYPSKLDAHKSKMNTEDYFDLAMDAMSLDYDDLNKKLKPLKELMDKTDKVRIVSPGTDLTFSIKEIPTVPCAGEFNIPDGEIFTAPVKDSVEGYITYNTPSPYRSEVYNGVKLEFEKGRIVNATASSGDNKKLNDIFDTDEGARFVGEFALGVNPLVNKVMGDILYDEKINGSLHFTPGSCYETANNCNKSTVHWDLVLIQTKEHGGGEIYFDDVLIRKDGLFTLDELKPLNK